MTGRDVTQADVARAAGVSRSLVSLALSGSPKVARETRERIASIASDLGYRVNLSAAALVMRRSTIIGLVLPNLRNAYFEQVARTLSDVAADVGLTLFVAVGSERPEVLRRSVEALLGVRVAGLILVSPWLAPAELVEIGDEVPTCVIGRTSPGGAVDSVRIDEDAAARLVTAHLRGLGMTTLAYVGPRVVHDSSRLAREAALVSAARDAGMELVARECGEDPGPAVRAVLESHPESLGLVLHNDMIAIDAVAAVRDAGRTAGRDFALVSYDDTYLAQREEFSLTSVDQPEEELAAQAVRLVRERAGMSGTESLASSPARNVLLTPRLVPRASSVGRSQPAGTANAPAHRDPQR